MKKFFQWIKTKYSELNPLCFWYIQCSVYFSSCQIYLKYLPFSIYIYIYREREREMGGEGVITEMFTIFLTKSFNYTVVWRYWFAWCWGRYFSRVSTHHWPILTLVYSWYTNSEHNGKKQEINLFVDTKTWYGLCATFPELWVIGLHILGMDRCY